MNKPLTNNLNRRRRAAVLVGLLAMTFGCAHTPPAPFRYDEEGRPVSFKRMERELERDFIHHISRKAYRVPRAKLEKKLRGDQIVIYEQWDAPDFQRRPFTSLQNERVEEWLYLDKARMFQFVGGMLVYEGPVTDFEQILLRRGYPNRAIADINDETIRVDVLVYDQVFRPKLAEFHFNNGKLTQSQEGI